MKRSGLIILALMLASAVYSQTEEFSEKEKAIIYTNTIKILNDYQSIINQMGTLVKTDVDKAKSNAETLLELFVNRQVLLYNDLDPSHKLSEFYEAETYASNVILWYPDGLSISLDIENAKVSKIMKHEATVFSIDLMVKKTMNGNYLKQTQNNNVEELTFRIAFGLENKTLTNFRIVGIRNAGSTSVIDFSKALKEVNSQNILEEDMAKIKVEIINRLSDYTNFLSLLGDPNELPADKEFYRTSLVKLFQNPDIKVYNDINPEPSTSLILINDYINTLTTDYPEGINSVKILTDSAKFGKVMKSDDGSFYTFVEAEKAFSGKFKGRDEFNKSFPLIFKISFREEGNTYTNFVINSIDITTVDFYQAAPGNTEEPKPELAIKPVTRKGFFVSVSASVIQSQINSKDIIDIPIADSSYSWSVSHYYKILPSIGISYYFSDNFAISTGAEYSIYSTSLNLDGTFKSDSLLPDINGNSFNRIVEASCDSILTVKYISVPLSLNITTGKPGKFGIYLEAGGNISFPLKASFTNTGNYSTRGYYPLNPAVTRELDWPELGYYTKTDFSESGTIPMKGYNLALHAAAGVSIPLGYYTSINVGPELYMGITDIHADQKKYIDVLGRTFRHQPTKIQYFGLKITFAYKL